MDWQSRAIVILMVLILGGFTLNEVRIKWLGLHRPLAPRSVPGGYMNPDRTEGSSGKAVTPLTHGVEQSVDSHGHSQDHPHPDPPLGMATGSRPLKSSGSGSQSELEAIRQKPYPPEAKALLTEAFELTFCVDSSKRNYPRGVELLEKLLITLPQCPEAYRILGYCYLNINFNMEKAREKYLKALEQDPNYGEVHYALAFLLAGMGDLGTGGLHFKKSQTLGIPDERGLREKYYPGM